METRHKNLHEMVQKAASLHSTRIAVVFDSCTEMGTKLRSYGELISFASELTNLLKERVRQNEQIIGLYCHPGINLPNWILGILQLPAAYAPLDPDAPPHLFVRFMEQCALRYALVQIDLLQRFNGMVSSHLCVDICEMWPTQGLCLVNVQPEVGCSLKEQPRVGSSQREQSSVGSSQREQSSVGSSEREQPSIGSSEREQPSVWSSERDQPSVGSSGRDRPSVGSSEGDQPSVWSSEGDQPSVGSSEGDQPSVGISERDQQGVWSLEGDHQGVGSSEGDQQGVGSTEGDQQDVGSSEGDQQDVGSSEGDQQGVGSSERDQQGIGSSEGDQQGVWSSEGDHLGVGSSERDHQGVGSSEADQQSVRSSKGDQQNVGSSEGGQQSVGSSEGDQQSVGISEGDQQSVGMSPSCVSDMLGQPGDSRWHSYSSPGSLAYVLHTSGTTGLPKTVRVPHRCIIPNILHLRSLFQVTPEDVVFMASPLTFDPSVVEMFVSLSSGACLLIVPTMIKKIPDKLAAVLFKQHKITVLQATPTLLGRFGAGVLRGQALSAASSLRVLALGGEPCPAPSVLRSWRGKGNSTRIYNLYGTTEVSCWATCHQLHLDTMSSEAVPLGSALMDTVVELRDEDGKKIAQGEGQVFIGGQDRVCFLGEEVIVAKGTMRGTGDWAELRDGHLYYLGRRDRLVKRHGQQLHLDALHQMLQSLLQVQMCAVTLSQAQRLVAFVVPSSCADSAPSCGKLRREILGRLSQVLPAYSMPDSIILLPALPLTAHGKVNMADLLQEYERQRVLLVSHDALGDWDTLRELLQKLWREALSLDDDAPVAMDSHFLLSGGDSLGSVRLCDDITVALDVALPGLLEIILSGSFSDLLSHVATATLQEAGVDDATAGDEHFSHPKRRRQHPELPVPAAQARKKRLRPPSTASEEPVSPNSLSSAGKELVGSDSISTPSEAIIKPHSLSTTSEKHLRPDSRSTASEALNGPDSISTLSEPLVRPDSISTPSEALVKPHRLSTPSEMVVRPDSLSTASDRVIRPESLSSKPLLRVRVVRRAGEVTELPPLSHQELNLHGNASPLPPNEGGDHTPSAGPGDRVDHSLSGPAGPIEKATDDSTVGVMGRASSAVALRVRWQSDTGRCVDASAVLLVSGWGDSDRAVAYVGSHSHRLQAITLKEGRLLWERVLGDRLEASAAVTPCGSLVAIGCYDGRVYFLSAAKGNTHWVFATENAVKSSPAVDILTGLILVGSHDGHMYALDPQAQCCRWSRHCGGGAIFSSPCLDPALRQLYVATLKGDLLCLSPESGALLWSHSNTTPFFSSPCCSNSSLCIGSVDNNIYCFSHRGSLLWQFPTDGPIFSSPCSRPTSLANQKVYCGSHDGCVYCLSDGALLWRFQAGGKVFSSPFPFPHPACAGEGLVAVATTNGTLWILGAEDGVPKASLSLPGEVFSSPVLWGRTLVVGCRNDYVYGIDLTFA